MIRSLCLAFVFSFILVTVAEAKIATAPFAAVIQESEMGKAANKLIESRIGKDQKQIEQDIAGFQKQDQDFKKEVESFQKQAATMAEKARNQKAQELDAKAQTLRQKATDIEGKRSDLAKKAGPLQQKINEEIMKVLQMATEKIAKDKKLDLILDTAPPVYFVSNSLSIKDELLEEVNKVWKKNGSKFKL